MNCDPVGLADIAYRLGLHRRTPIQWRQRHDDFPRPRWSVSGLPAWDWADDVLPWLRQTGRLNGRSRATASRSQERR